MTIPFKKQNRAALCEAEACGTLYSNRGRKRCQDGKLRCPTCKKKYQYKERLRREPDYAAKRLVYNRQYKYKITETDLNRLLELQQNSCATCKQIFSDHKEVMVDHSTKNGSVIVRGLLCRTCNLALGYIHDNPSTAISLFSYLSKSVRPSWDEFFLMLAQTVASRSKDPSTQVGAVIVASDRSIISMGYNGIPRGVEDSAERLTNRDIKYRIICHAENNAIVSAKRDLKGSTLYTYPFMSCAPCAGMVIQAGIKRCVSYENNNPRWQADFDLTRTMFQEAGIELILYKD